jgi:hypothetical protein
LFDELKHLHELWRRRIDDLTNVENIIYHIQKMEMYKARKKVTVCIEFTESSGVELDVEKTESSSGLPSDACWSPISGRMYTLKEVRGKQVKTYSEMTSDAGKDMFFFVSDMLK